MRTVAFQRPRRIRAFGSSTETTILRLAGSGDLPTVDFSSIPPGEVGAYVDYNDLNMRVRGYKRGIDVVGAFTHDLDFVL